MKIVYASSNTSVNFNLKKFEFFFGTGTFLSHLAQAEIQTKNQNGDHNMEEEEEEEEGDDKIVITLPRDFCVSPVELRVLAAALVNPQVLLQVDEQLWERFYEDATNKNKRTVASTLGIPCGMLNSWRLCALLSI